MNFDQIETRYRELLAQRSSGTITPAQFDQLAQALRVQDAQQRWWQIDPADGQWQRWDGGHWISDLPPHAPPAPTTPTTPAAPASMPPELAAGMEKAADIVQRMWRRFLDRMISPAEFLRQGQLPLAQRSQGWWDVLAVGGGALSGYIWFLYSSIRGMPHFKLLGMSGGRDVWYDFVPSLLLAALPFVLMAFRGQVMARLQQLWTRITASISYAMMLGAGLIVGAILLNYLSPALFGWAFAFREGLDFTTPLLMVGIPVALAIFRPETDRLISPLQPVRQQVPKALLVGMALAVPYGLAFVLYRLSFSQYELLHWNLALGILIPYVLLRSPPPAALAVGGGPPMLMVWLGMGGLLLFGLFVPEARADDCARDIFNLRDCLRTGGYAEVLSGAAASVVSVLVNGSELVRTFLPPPTGPQQAAGPDAATPAPAPVPSPSPVVDGTQEDPHTELDRINKQWDDASRGVDPKDPGYNDFKKQYDDYRQWLQDKIAADDAARAAAEAEARAAEAAAREAAERQADWVRQREEDLKQVREGQSFIAATAAGASQAGFKTAEHDRQLKDLRDREAELTGQISAAGGDTSYQAAQRDVIPVGEGFKEAIRLAEEQKRQAALEAARIRLQAAQKAQEQTERDYWKTVKEEFWGDVVSDVDAIPGQLKDAAKAGLKTIGETVRDAKDALTDANNWQALGQAVVQTGKDLVGSPLQSAKKVGGFYGNVAGTAAKVGGHIITHPLETIKAIAGVDNWEKSMDPNVPVTERIGRVLVGIADAAVNLAGVGLADDAVKAAKAADAALDAAKVTDKVVDAAKAADKAGSVVRNADKVLDTARTADKVGDAAKEGKAVRTATKAETSVVTKPAAAADAAAGKAARAEARTAQQGQGRYAIESDPKVNVQSKLAGVTAPAQKHAQVVADKFGVKLDVRSTTSYAHDRIASGKAVPKAAHCKTKTINDADVLLGASENNKGLAGYFKPKQPVQGNMSDKDFKKLTDRFNERQQEYKDQWEHLTQLKKEGKTYVKDGVVYDAKAGKPYTGDHDIFDIRDATTGQPLPRYQVDPKGNVIFVPEMDHGKVIFNADGTPKLVPKLNPVREQIIKELQQPPFSAQHGAHMDWKYDHLNDKLPAGAPAGAQSDFAISRGVDQNVLGKHTTDGGDALITFGADQPPSGSWFKGER